MALTFPVKKSGSALAAIAVAFVVMAVSPARADELDDAVNSPLGQGDAQFQQLFSGWEKLDTPPAQLSNAVAKVSVPSRMPLEGARLTSDFGMRMHPVLGGRRQHKGIDLASPVGTPVYATADGYVGKAENFSSYGNYVQLHHGGSLETRYAHLSRIGVTEGSRVRKGDIIGYVGSTGRSTGPHLHYEVRVAGEAVNPVPYMVETTAQQAFALARGDSRAVGAE